MIEESLPNFEEEMAKIQRREIGEEATQMHLVRQYIRYGKWKGFSKDSAFKKRCDMWRRQATYLMGRDPRCD